MPPRAGEPAVPIVETFGERVAPTFAKGLDARGSWKTPTPSFRR